MKRLNRRFHAIPNRIKKIISKIKGGAFNINKLAAFFKQANRKKDVSNVSQSLKIDLTSLKKHLNEIERKCYWMLDRGYEKEKDFMKSLKRITNQLSSTPSPFDHNSTHDIIDKIPNDPCLENEIQYHKHT